jgi:hypothetical protein
MKKEERRKEKEERRKKEKGKRKKEEGKVHIYNLYISNDHNFPDTRVRWERPVRRGKARSEKPSETRR